MSFLPLKFLTQRTYYTGPELGLHPISLKFALSFQILQHTRLLPTGQDSALPTLTSYYLIFPGPEGSSRVTPLGRPPTSDYRAACLSLSVSSLD